MQPLTNRLLALLNRYRTHTHSLTPAFSHSSLFSSRCFGISFRSFSSSVSPVERDILSFLKSIRVLGSDSSSDIVYSGVVSSVSERSGVVSVSLVPDRFYRDYKRLITDELTNKLQQINPNQNWQVRVSMNIPERSGQPGAKSAAPIAGLQGVKHIICVSSCKGGVGKSTVAVNLAYALAQRDLRVGLFDADIYGPSLPTLVQVDQPKPEAQQSAQQSQLIAPLTAFGVKLMSYGFMASANPKAAAIMRGAMVSNVVRDLLGRTNWGILDFLVIDMPPGTGDIAITLIQSINFRGSVIVTTPQRLSYVDVVKGIELFQKTAVPILALVENMSFFVCDQCEQRHQIFGQSHLPLITANYPSIQRNQTFQFPILPQICSSGDSGDPFVLRADGDKQNQIARSIYSELAETVERQCEEAFAESKKTPIVKFDPVLKVLRIDAPGEEPRFANPRTVRLACRCAACVDEFTGEKKLRPASVAKDVRPTGIQARGNYAVAMAWSDGHASSLFPFEQLRSLAHSTPEQAANEAQDTK